MTVDQHQPPRRRSRARQAQGEVPDRPEDHRCAAASFSWPPRSVVGWWFWSLQRDVGRPRSADRRCRARDAAAPERHSAGRAVRGAARAAAAARHADRSSCGKGRPARCICSIRSASALPEAMWLTDLRQAGSEITIDGRCTSLNALVGFRQRARSVEPVRAAGRDRRQPASRPATPATPELIRFSVRARQLAKAAD